MDEKDVLGTKTVLRVQDIGIVHGGEWCQASHGIAFQLYSDDIFFFDAHEYHCGCEVRPEVGCTRYTYGCFLSRNLVEGAKKGVEIQLDALPRSSNQCSRLKYNKRWKWWK